MSMEIVHVDLERSYPPRPTETTKIFWDAIAAGQFKTTRCTSCGKLTFPPKPICPHCWSDSMEWADLSGKGTLYSRTIIHAAPAIFAKEAPIHFGIIDLEEGIRIATRIWDMEPLEIGSPMRIVTLQYNDGPLFAARKA
ncbi:MAG: Zn-ribbon domain-containing OB-fold protein [Flavobacteriaceae bacterium]